jgi:hypothetical protein
LGIGVALADQGNDLALARSESLIRWRKGGHEKSLITIKDQGGLYERTGNYVIWLLIKRIKK